MHTGQGNQVTSFAWAGRLKQAGPRISMDGKGRCIGNVLIERLWGSLRRECASLHAREAGSQANTGIGDRASLHDRHRPHAAHGGVPPAVAYQAATQPDQQTRRAAWNPPDPVRPMGISSDPASPARHRLVAVGPHRPAGPRTALAGCPPRRRTRRPPADRDRHAPRRRPFRGPRRSPRAHRHHPHGHGSRPRPATSRPKGRPQPGGRPGSSPRRRGPARPGWARLDYPASGPTTRPLTAGTISSRSSFTCIASSYCA